MGHRRNGAPQATTTHLELDDDAADRVAAILHGLATPSRLHLVVALQHGPVSVGELAATIGMERSAVSHQLRHLRDLGFVTAERDGRRVVHRLADDHVVDLVAQALAHAEHLRVVSEGTGTASTTAPPQPHELT